ncbi:ribonuclease inhibitor-like isoform X2 [Colossoma macropomum]|nr:ribonuclease inhibitor-like isoform X2 [Colossoma macropomum]
MMVEWIRLHLPFDTTDTLVHQYKGYEDRNERQMESYVGRTALFKEELKKGNTSLKLSAVQPSDEGAYQCYIKSLGWYDDVTVIVEVKGKGFHAWKIAIICISVFAIILIIFTACILKDKFSEKKLSPAQCSVITYMRLQSVSVKKEFDLKKFNTSEEGYRRLIPAISNYRKAQFAGYNLTVHSIKTLTEALQTENSSLKELDLSKNNLEPSVVELLSAGLKSSHCKLEILRLAICNFTVESCKSLVTALQTKVHSMKELDLCSYDLQDSGGMELLFAGLKPGDCKLEILRLPLCNLGINTCEKLGSVLKMENSSLKEMDLSNNDLQDSGVELLSAGLKNLHCKLEILRLSGCMITAKGCSSLASALSSNPSHLKDLDLTYNHPGESGVKLLSARREDPHCSLSTLRVEHGGENRIKTGLKKYSCEVTLDPNTAHSSLCLSEGNRKVQRVEFLQSYPEHPERFDEWYQVLCRESLTGRCYWEAEWSGDVNIAVTYKSISRKGRSDDCLFGRNEKSWILCCSNKRYFVRHNKNRTILSAPPSSSDRVGVYVDCLAGSLSFYSVSSDTNTMTHLHTFKTTFTEPLCAGFYADYYSSVCLK